MSDHYECPQCNGLGRVELTPMAQETIDACRRIAARGESITMRSLTLELPAQTLTVLSGRMVMLRRRGLIRVVEGDTTNYYVYEVV